MNVSHVRTRQFRFACAHYLCHIGPCLLDNHWRKTQVIVPGIAFCRFFVASSWDTRGAWEHVIPPPDLADVRRGRGSLGALSQPHIRFASPPIVVIQGSEGPCGQRPRRSAGVGYAELICLALPRSWLLAHSRSWSTIGLTTPFSWHGFTNRP